MAKKLESIELDLDLLLFRVKGIWKPDDTEKRAAWDLYIELVTRISLVELKKGEGILREALTSLYSIFPTSREVLRKYGPELAIPRKGATYSLGKLVTEILNYQIRPFLTKWHPMLQDYESGRQAGVSLKFYEDKWDQSDILRKELKDMSIKLWDYSVYLAKAAGVEPLMSNVRGE